MAKTLIVIAGPTAIGKTTLAIKLAQKYHTEIISADSRQFYREMEIGTAKPSLEELKVAKHHFINSLSVNDHYTVGDYEKEALLLIDELFKKHDVIILVGGSGLFIKAIIDGFDDLPASSEEIRKGLNDLFKIQGITSLQKKLKEVDPVFYNEVDLNNPQRLIRALEVYETTGKPFSDFRNDTKKKRPFDIIQIGLNIEREKLYENINLRVDLMVDNGLVQEVLALRQFRHLNPLNTVGYSELFDYFDEKLTLKEAIGQIKQNTRRFAKRQLTWFRKAKDFKWFEPQEDEMLFSYLESVLEDPAHVVRKS